MIAYERYLESKNRNTKELKLPIDEAKRLRDYINKKIREIEKWLMQKGKQEKSNKDKKKE